MLLDLESRLAALEGCAQRVHAKFKDSHCRFLLSECLVTSKLVSHALSPGLLESSVCHDHGEEGDRRYDMREALSPLQKRHKRGKNHNC